MDVNLYREVRRSVWSGSNGERLATSRAPIHRSCVGAQSSALQTYRGPSRRSCWGARVLCAVGLVWHWSHSSLTLWHCWWGFCISRTVLLLGNSVVCCCCCWFLFICLFFCCLKELLCIKLWCTIAIICYKLIAPFCNKALYSGS